MHYTISDEHMLPCMWKKTTGLECPGCGTQRSLARLSEGRVGDSFVLFPALMPMMFLFAFVPVYLIFSKRLSTDWLMTLFLVSAFVIFGAFFLRNLPS